MNTIIALSTVAVAVIWSLIQGFHVTMPMSSPLALLLLGVAVVRFQEERFKLCLMSLVQIVLFSGGFIVLTYLGAHFNRPLIDAYLARCDAMLGFQGLQHRVFDCVYDTLLIQTALVVAILGFANDRKQLDTFITRLMAAGFITFAFFLFFPALGRITVPSDFLTVYVEQFNALRSGTLNKIDFANMTGLITFPSFHTIWACLLTAALVHRKCICLPFLVLNILVIRSTMTVGAHYLTDVLAGFVVFLIVMVLIRPKSHIATGDTRHP